MYRYGPGLMARATGTGGYCHLQARDLASGRVSLAQSRRISLTVNGIMSRSLSMVDSGPPHVLAPELVFQPNG